MSMDYDEHVQYIKDRIANATSEVMSNSDVGANVAICDKINQEPELADLWVKYVRKRLDHKNPQVGVHCLALLDMMMKMCPCVHPTVGTEEFLKPFYKIVPKQVRDPHSTSLFARLSSNRDMRDADKQEKLLVLIQTWARDFRNSPYTIFQEVYQKLLRKGCKFPDLAAEDMVSVFDPPKKAVPKQPENKDGAASASRASASSAPGGPPMNATPPASSRGPDQFRDTDCQNAVGSCTLLMDVLNNDPGDLNSNEVVNLVVPELLRAQTELTSRVNLAMQTPGFNQQLLEEILAATDRLAQTLQYYDGIKDGTIKRPGKQQQAAAASAPAKAASGSAATPEKKAPAKAAGDLLDLDFFAAKDTPPKASAPPSQTASVVDIFGGPAAPTSSAGARPAAAGKQEPFDPFGVSASAPAGEDASDPFAKLALRKASNAQASPPASLSSAVPSTPPNPFDAFDVPTGPARGSVTAQLQEPVPVKDNPFGSPPPSNRNPFTFAQPAPAGSSPAAAADPFGGAFDPFAAPAGASSSSTASSATDPFADDDDPFAKLARR